MALLSDQEMPDSYPPALPVTGRLLQVYQIVDVGLVALMHRQHTDDPYAYYLCTDSNVWQPMRLQ